MPPGCAQVNRIVVREPNTSLPTVEVEVDVIASTVIRAARAVASARVSDGIPPPNQTAGCGPRDPPPLTPDGWRAGGPRRHTCRSEVPRGARHDEGAGSERSDDDRHRPGPGPGRRVVDPHRADARGLRRRLAAGQRLRREPPGDPGDRARRRPGRLAGGAARGHHRVLRGRRPRGPARGGAAVPAARGRRRQPAARGRLHPGDRHRRWLAGREDPRVVRRVGHLDRRSGHGHGRPRGARQALEWLRDPSETWQAVAGAAIWIALSVFFRFTQKAVGSSSRG